MHFLGLAGMPRRIPDFPDMYWSWNYISSVGSLVSVFGVFIFFYILFDAFFGNSLFFQVKNNYYIMILNNNLLSSNKSSFSKNSYVMLKYNFFNNYITDSLYSSFDKVIFSFLLKDFIKYNLIIKNDLSIKEVVLYDLTKLGLSKYFYLDNNFVLRIELFSILNYLIFGWTSLLVVFLYTSNIIGYKLVKINFLNIIINKFIFKKMALQLFYFIRYSLLIEKTKIYFSKCS